MNIFKKIKTYVGILRELPDIIAALKTNIKYLEKILFRNITGGEIKFMKLDDRATIPEYKSYGDSGMDIRTIEDYNLAPGKKHIFKTGLACSVAEGFEVQVRPRSGLACKKGITVINTPGTIDANYRGEICVGLINLSDEYVHIEKDNRIAQLVVARVDHPNIIEVDNLDETDRGSKGFGSSGVK